MSALSISPEQAAAFFKSIPECGASCLVEAINTASNCSLTDPACSCASQAVQAVAGACVLRSCTIPEALSFQNQTYSLCGIPSTNEQAFIPVIYSFVAFSTVIVALRFIVRLTERIPLWWDDYSALVSVLISIGFTVLCALFGELGVGHHIWAVPQENISPILILFWSALLCYVTSRFFVRISISLFLLRIFRVSGARPLILLSIALNVAITITYIFCIIFQCTPISYFWNVWDGLHEGRCIDQWAVFLSGGIIATSLDVVLILLPIHWISQLQFSRAKKITTLGMFSLGVLVIVTSIMRIVSLYKFTHSHDVTRNLPDLAIWGGLELYAANICACLPSLRPLVTLSVSSFKAWTTGASKTAGSASHGLPDYPMHGGGKKKLPSDDGNNLSQFDSRTATSNDLERLRDV
ncbi:putative CFEM-containing protein [Rosellinia necatrix]|uniref:Putative CFEM-containing protein n=1 Tax=Rosellinia necatrix TaxID=77044 RepID=A0A1W2TIW0_ROSNE|nr:putative CFEM-containing protein [Rosellinia necatrix]